MRSLPETREASTSMDEDVLLWTTAQSEGDEQSIILVAEPTASTTITHLDDPPGETRATNSGREKNGTSSEFSK